MSVNNERQGKVETYISPNSVLCAWMTPESNIKISLTRIERIDCRGQVVQRKEQVKLSEEELCTLKRFPPCLTSSSTFNDSNTSVMLPSKRGLYLLKLVLVPKRQPGVQMNLTSSELPNEIQKILREVSVKKVVYHAKTDHVSVNYLVEMHDNENDTTNVKTGYTQYQIFYCLEK